MDITKKITNEFNLKEQNVVNIIALLDEGNTIPFIARYRKEMTGHIDDQILREFADRLEYLRNLEKRKEEIEKAIEGQGKMTEEIRQALINAETLTEAEDVYRPFKQKKATRATVAIEKGLEPLAKILLEQNLKSGSVEELAVSYIDPDKKVESAQDALAGARDIVAEWVSDNAELRKKLRKIFLKNGIIYSKLTKKEGDGALTYENYADYDESVAEIKSHRILALNRGEDEGYLKIKVEIDKDFGIRVCETFYVKEGSITTEQIKIAVADAYDRLIKPSIEREIRGVLTESAQEQAIKMFEVNLKPLLMQPPLKNKVTMGFDPAYRTGCKIAVVDQTGKFLDKTVVYPTPPQSKVEEAKLKLIQMIKNNKVDVISIGNGTASKESEMFVADMLKEVNVGDRKVVYTVVNEAGASVYSASKLGAEEFPDFDVSERSAVSIARRLQDPLAELIKIDPKSIGVGQYQHDMPKARLDSVLNGVLEDCVNAVGVDLNTASASLLGFVSGLNKSIVKNIVEYREKNGKFSERAQLLKVSKLGEKAYLQCAGFLRITDGSNILDNTGIHPESYGAVTKLLQLFGYSDQEVKGGIKDLPNKVKAFGAEKVAEYCGIGVPTLNDIVNELIKPGRDIRDSLPQPVLRADIMDINDLKEGMVIKGTVRNVIDFGAFVDIGVHQDGLIHISEISDSYIKHPSEALKVGQSIEVMVIGVDLKKNRIALSLKRLNKKVDKSTL